MLMTSTRGSMEVREVAPALMREFPNLHMTERRPNMLDRSRKPIAFNRPGAQLLNNKVMRKFKEANVAEDLDGISQLDEVELEALNAELGSFDVDADDETAEEASTTEQDCDIDGALAAELEALSTVLEEAENDPELARELGNSERGVESMMERLITVRESRGRVKELRKDR
eukprot:2889313-Pyramimonas_sp.AAC.1